MMVALRIPLADAGAFARVERRTTLLRIALAAAVLLAAILCLLFARRLDSQPSSYFAGGTSGVVVVDFSTSIDPGKYRRIDRVLRTIVRTSQPVSVTTTVSLKPTEPSPGSNRYGTRCRVMFG